MARLFYHTMQDSAGNLLFDVVGTVRVAGTGTLATIYGDEAGTVPIGNPLANHPSFGSFKFYVGPGSYDFYMAKAGYTFETLTGLQGLGTMASQNANNVVISGGSIQGIGALVVNGQSSLQGSVGVGVVPPAGSNTLHVGGIMSVQTGIDGSVALNLLVNKATQFGMVCSAVGSDSATNATLLFKNTSNGVVGSVTTTGAATAYNTSSDGRLKEAVEPLRDALETVQRLQPVRFQWKADGSVGHGLIAQEVQAVVPGVVSGDAASEMPMGIDYSKLVPWLVAAVKELTQQVEMLTAKLAASSA